MLGKPIIDNLVMKLLLSSAMRDRLLHLRKRVRKMANRCGAQPSATEQNQTFGFKLDLPRFHFTVKLLNRYKLKGLILAQNERWRRGVGMQVEREALF